MASLYGSRPSALLYAADPYTAYCLDEAGAWLLGQKEPPDYGGKRQLNGNKKLMAALEKVGGVKILHSS